MCCVDAGVGVLEDSDFSAGVFRHETDHDLQQTICIIFVCLQIMCLLLCVVVPGSVCHGGKHAPDRAGHAVTTRQHELDHADAGQESICLLKNRDDGSGDRR